jgi:Flp pilus assembly protein TadG
VGERGAAVVEFVVVFLALLVPLVYAIVVMADVQRALLATSGAAREVGRLYVTAPDRGEARARVERAYAEVLGNYGLRAGGGRDRLEVVAGCPGAPAACAGGFGPGAEVRVVVTYRVAVARLPFLGAVAGPSVTVGAAHRTRADRFRGFGL